MTRILMRHLSGSRANQVDEFNAEQTAEVTLGRDESATIRLDALNDDLVSRQHCRIVRGEQDAFQIVDLQSRNGTFVNGQRLFVPAALNHNDVIQLGPGGPEIRFEIEPPPGATAGVTREAGAVFGSSAPLTREFTAEDSTPRPVGRVTVERMLDETFSRVQHESSKSMWVGIAAAVLLTILGTSIYLYLRRATNESAQLAQQQQKLLQQMDQELKKEPGEAQAMRQEVSRLNTELKRAEARNQEAFVAVKQQLASRNEQETPASQKVPAQSQNARASVREIKESPASDYDTVLKSGVEMFAAGKVTEAIQAASRLITGAPNRWEGYALVGAIARSQNRPSDAKLAYEKAMALAPEPLQPKLKEIIQQLGAKAE